MKKLLLAGAAASALSLLAQSGHAADLAQPVYKAPPPVVPVFSWTGCYVGAQVGWGWERDRIRQHGESVFIANTILTSNSDGHADSHGAVLGGQAGCDYQAGSWVFGVQAMGLGTNITGISQDPHNGQRRSFLAPFNGGSIATRTNYLASVTGRLGFTGWSPQVMGYIKGGGAWTQVQYDLRNADLRFAPDPNSALFTTGFSGWTVGGGFEWMVATSWSAFVEYNYYSFSEKLVASVNNGVVLGVGLANSLWARPQISTVTVGLNYRFNSGGPVVAKY
jgi:outer membrane immunogenic protein